MKIKIYSLAWDTDDGNGCQLYTTEKERDAELRLALLSWLDEEPDSEKFANHTASDLIEHFDSNNLWDGQRYVTDEHVLDTADCEPAPVKIIELGDEYVNHMSTRASA